MEKIYISCVDSNLNPSAGIGIAKSIKQQFPEFYLIGVDYSEKSTGLYHSIFDDIIIQPAWSDIDLEEYQKEILNILSKGEFWISSLDIELKWIASFAQNNKYFLGPNIAAINLTHKPVYGWFKNSHIFKIPTFLLVNKYAINMDKELDFCRRKDWNVFLKSKYFDAVKVNNFYDLRGYVESFKITWPNDILFLQEQILGREVSFCLIASNGVLLYVIGMRKILLTPQGKTWGGDLFQPEDVIISELKQFVSDTYWNGALEIECAINSLGEIYVFDINPRFPAWIYGATICGINMPSMLLSSKLENNHDEQYPVLEGKKSFVRVVEEIEIQFERVGITHKLEGLGNFSSSKFKMASNMPQLAIKLSNNSNLDGGHCPYMDRDGENSNNIESRYMIQDFLGSTVKFEKIITPYRLFSSKMFQNNLSQFKEIFEKYKSHYSINFNLAFSVKTNPDCQLLPILLKGNYLVEVISIGEAHFVLQNGFDCSKIIWNGPAKFIGEMGDIDYFQYVFFDSLHEFRLIKDDVNLFSRIKYIGFRLSLSSMNSRFGICIDNYSEFIDLVNCIMDLPHTSISFHFHFASSYIGTNLWGKLVSEFLSWIKLIQQATLKKVHIIDFGGGWHHRDIVDMLPKIFEQYIFPYLSEIDGVETLFLEPGKALIQNSYYLVVTIIGFRNNITGGIDVICDGSIAEMPLIQEVGVKVFLFKYKNNCISELYQGQSRLLGRLCMENDILLTGVNLDEVEIGDKLLFSNAGAYNLSMSYEFGRGGLR